MTPPYVLASVRLVEKLEISSFAFSEGYQRQVLLVKACGASPRSRLDPSNEIW